MKKIIISTMIFLLSSCSNFINTQHPVLQYYNDFTIIKEPAVLLRCTLEINHEDFNSMDRIKQNNNYHTSIQGKMHIEFHNSKRINNELLAVKRWFDENNIDGYIPVSLTKRYTGIIVDDYNSSDEHEYSIGFSDGVLDAGWYASFTVVYNNKTKQVKLGSLKITRDLPYSIEKHPLSNLKKGYIPFTKPHQELEDLDRHTEAARKFQEQLMKNQD